MIEAERLLSSPTLQRLAALKVGEYSNRPVWLERRSHGVTATDIARLAKEGPAFEARLIKEKLAGGDTPDLGYIPRIAWGHIREREIAEWAQDRFNVQPSDALYACATNPRHLATPDGVGVDWEDGLLLEETKTSKYDLDPDIKDGYYYSTTYYDQKQWQMHVTGAMRVLFVWERHDDNWSEWPLTGPKPINDFPSWKWVKRDQARINELVALANNFLRKLDAARTESAPADVVDPDIDALARAVIDARREEAAAIEKKKAAWEQLTKRADSQAFIRNVSTYSQESLTAKVTYTPPAAAIEDVPDFDAAVAANQALYARYLAVQSKWEGQLAKFTKPMVVPKKSHLTVTPVISMEEVDDD